MKPHFKFLLPLVLAIALFMENIDSNILSTSLPVIANELNTSVLTLKLSLMSYLVALALFIPISGWLSDRFTARHIFCMAMLIFIFGSLLCSLSQSLSFFVFARFIQGMGGSMFVPVGRIILLRNTPKEDIVSSLSWLAIPATAGPLIGPPLGGFITTYFTWQWMFLINIPIGFLGIACGFLLLPKNETPMVKTFDWKGFLLSAITLSCFISGLSIVSIAQIPKWFSLSLTFIGIIFGILYVIQALNHPRPVLDIKLLGRRPTFCLSIASSSFLRIATGSIAFLLPLMLQLGFQFSPITSGMITLSAALGAIFAKLGVTYLYNHFNFWRVLFISSLFSALFIAIIAFFTASTNYIMMVSILFIGGLMRSTFFSGINALTYGEIDIENMSHATTLSTVAQQISLALGVAVGGMVLEILLKQYPPKLTIFDFQCAFFIMGFVALISPLLVLKLPRSVGNNLKKNSA